MIDAGRLLVVSGIFLLALCGACDSGSSPKNAAPSPEGNETFWKNCDTKSVVGKTGGTVDCLYDFDACKPLGQICWWNETRSAASCRLQSCLVDDDCLDAVVLGICEGKVCVEGCNSSDDCCGHKCQGNRCVDDWAGGPGASCMDSDECLMQTIGPPCDTADDTCGCVFDYVFGQTLGGCQSHGDSAGTRAAACILGRCASKKAG